MHINALQTFNDRESRWTGKGPSADESLLRLCLTAPCDKAICTNTIEWSNYFVPIIIN